MGFSAVFLVAPNRRTAVSGQAAFVGRHASVRTHRRAGGSSFARERSNALVPIFAHGVGVSLLAEVARSLYFTPVKENIEMER